MLVICEAGINSNCERLTPEILSLVVVAQPLMKLKVRSANNADLIIGEVAVLITISGQNETCEPSSTTRLGGNLN